MPAVDHDGSAWDQLQLKIPRNISYTGFTAVKKPAPFPRTFVLMAPRPNPLDSNLLPYPWSIRRRETRSMEAFRGSHKSGFFCSFGFHNNNLGVYLKPVLNLLKHVENC